MKKACSHLEAIGRHRTAPPSRSDSAMSSRINSPAGRPRDSAAARPAHGAMKRESPRAAAALRRGVVDACVLPHCAHLTGTTSGFPFSTIYVASSAALPLPTFFTAWIVPAGMNKTSPALSVTGGLPSS